MSRWKRRAEEEQERWRQEFKAHEEKATVEAERTGYWPLFSGPPVAPMFKCCRCSVGVFDREVHEAWHASLGQEFPK